MANVTLNLLYQEIRRLHEEVSEIRNVLMPEEELTSAERRELKATLEEMKGGKEKNWRDSLKG